MLRIIHFVQNLSLDITAGAMISCWFICSFLSIEASMAMVTGLGIAIWLIYTADHLLDARKVKGDIINPRHEFHKRYQRPIIIIALMVFALGVYNAFQLPEKTIYYGLVLVGFSGFYFLYLKISPSQRFKELFAALVYTAGLFTGPLSLVSEPNAQVFVLGLLFFLHAFANLLILPLFEREIDEQQGVLSIVTRKGYRRVNGLARITLGISFVLIISLVAFSTQFDEVASVFLLMSLSLLALLLRPGLFQKYQLYRMVGDGVFFLPGLLLL